MIFARYYHILDVTSVLVLYRFYKLIFIFLNSMLTATRATE